MLKWLVIMLLIVFGIVFLIRDDLRGVGPIESRSVDDLERIEGRGSSSSRINEMNAASEASHVSSW